MITGCAEHRPTAVSASSASSQAIQMVAIGDINGDGKNDNAILLPPDGTVTLIVSGVGTTNLSVGKASAMNIAAADIDGDGKAELVIGAPDYVGGSGGFWIIPGGADLPATGSGKAINLAYAEFYGISGGMLGIGVQIEVCDTNHDGLPDFVVHARKSQAIATTNGVQEFWTHILTAKKGGKAKDKLSPLQDPCHRP